MKTKNSKLTTELEKRLNREVIVDGLMVWLWSQVIGWFPGFELGLGTKTMEAVRNWSK